MSWMSGIPSGSECDTWLRELCERVWVSRVRESSKGTRVGRGALTPRWTDWGWMVGSERLSHAHTPALGSRAHARPGPTLSQERTQERTGVVKACMQGGYATVRAHTRLRSRHGPVGTGEDTSARVASPLHTSTSRRL